MSRPAFLDAPFIREAHKDRKLFDYFQKGKERFPEITEEDILLLKKQFPNNIGGTTDCKNTYIVWAPRTQYTCIKVVEGVFKVIVHAVSNRMDTSKPKDTYFLVRKSEQ